MGKTDHQGTTIDLNVLLELEHSAWTLFLHKSALSRGARLDKSYCASAK